MLLYGAFVGGLYWPIALACSAIISLTKGTDGQYSPWCSINWQGNGVSATAHTSC